MELDYYEASKVNSTKLLWSRVDKNGLVVAASGNLANYAKYDI
jgi:hypothetical protein